MPTPERWARIATLFRRALERERGERSAFLAEACEGDLPLRHEVESLIVEHERSGDSLDVPPVMQATLLDASGDDTHEPDLLGLTVGGKYRIDALLGKGGMGAVYRAAQVDLDRTVAVKVVLGELVGNRKTIARFKHEAIAVARLRHPHIVTVYDFGIDPEAGAYLVMEYLDGHSLRQEIRDRGQLPVARTIQVMTQVCRAMQAAHDAGVIHRDLKPDNVFLSGARRETAKVLDFGIAKLVLDPQTPDLTMAGAMIGTPVYMSPEQCEGKAVDVRADIYALGCVAYEMLAGRPPFLAGSVAALMHKHLHEIPVSPDRLRGDVPPALNAAILRALAKTPDGRFPGVAEFAEAMCDTAAVTVQEGPRLEYSTEEGERLAETAIYDTKRETAPPNNLPESLTSFVGRGEDLAAVVAAVRGARLVTLTGPGGIGKTRLALQAAAGLAREFPDGTWFVELAPLADPAHLVAAVAAVLGVQEQPGRSLLVTLADALKGSNALLVLDNCEHLVERAAEVADTLLRGCPNLRVLATSRERLGVGGEAVRPIAPLAVPGLHSAPSLNALLEVDAARLFVDRARLVRPGYNPNESDCAAIAALCRHLDGIPLAIELAAARVKLLSVEQILAKIGDRFRLLTSGPRTASLRQQTLKAAIDWSYSLLTADERMLLSRLSVFAGSWPAEAAETVCSGRGIDELAVFDLLDRLVDKSLAVVDQTGEAPRFRMLETIREYARERLAESGEAEHWFRKQAAWCLGLAREARRELRGPRQTQAYLRLDTEYDNIRAALQWSVHQAGDAEVSLRLTGALAMFWNIRLAQSEGRQWTEEALRLDSAGLDRPRGHAAYGLSLLAFTQADFERARSAIDECLTLRRNTDDWSGIARAMNYRAVIACEMGDYETGIEIQTEGLSLAREHNLSDEANYGTYSLGMLAMRSGDLDRARALLEESLAVWRAAGHHLAVASVLATLAEVVRLRDDHVLARRHIGECQEIARELGARGIKASADVVLAQVLCDEGRFDEAKALLLSAVEPCRESNGTGSLLHIVEIAARIRLLEGDAARALRLTGAVVHLREKYKTPRHAVYRQEVEDLTNTALGMLRESQSGQAEAPGADLPLDAVLDQALGP